MSKRFFLRSIKNCLSQWFNLQLSFLYFNKYVIIGSMKRISEQLEIQKQQPLVPYEDANRDNPPYNQGFYGFDPTSQYVGKYTVIDEIHNSTKYKNKDGLSSNPMDPNWGGAVFTAEKVADGELNLVLINKSGYAFKTNKFKTDNLIKAFD